MKGLLNDTRPPRCSQRPGPSNAWRSRLNFSPPARNLLTIDRNARPTGQDMTGPLERIYERVLVLRCQAGDEAAFAELVGRYAPRLRYYLRRLLEGDPDDVLQEVWLDVFRGLPRLADAGAFPAWLYRVARDRALRSRRGRRPPVALPEGDWPDEPDEGLTAEDAEAIHAALAELPPEQREVLVLRFL